MSTAMEPEPLKAEPASGRLMRFTVSVLVGSLILTVLVAWLLGSHVSAPAGQAGARVRTSSSSTTLFYRAANQMSFRRDGDGRYRVDTEMNEIKFRFVVDPNTPTVMLSQEDARAAGIDTRKLDFSARAATPGGEMRVASVVIPMMTLKQLTLFNVSALVTEGSLLSPVLGIGFLKRFDSYEMRDGELVLRW